jgi:hypothetical protein
MKVDGGRKGKSYFPFRLVTLPLSHRFAMEKSKCNYLQRNLI